MMFYRKIKDSEKEADREQAFKMIRFFNNRLLKNIIKFQRIVREKLVIVRRKRQELQVWLRNK